MEAKDIPHSILKNGLLITNIGEGSKMKSHSFSDRFAVMVHEWDFLTQGDRQLREGCPNPDSNFSSPRETNSVFLLP